MITAYERERGIADDSLVGLSKIKNPGAYFEPVG